MTILVSGGGTGGHITPILAVVHEIKKLRSDVRVVYVGERGGKFQALVEDHAAVDEVLTVYAGKFRRYHGESLLRRIFDLKTLCLNIRDLFFVPVGVIQALIILKRIKPDVVFLKGGYVGVPVGLAAAIKNIPFATHDSDALPGLANRIVGRWAMTHATGLPTEFYNYPKTKTVYVGVLVGQQYVPVDPNIQASYKNELSIPQAFKVLLITGGSLGAQRLNQAVSKLVPHLLQKYPDLYIIHQVGKNNLAVYDQVAKNDRLKVLEFMAGMHRYTGAADVVVARAGANTLAELGVQGKACIVVPNPQLSGGHQLKNAEYLVQHDAVVAINEDTFNGDANDLLAAIERLLEYPEQRQKLADALQHMTKTNAAQELAMLLIELSHVKDQQGV